MGVSRSDLQMQAIHNLSGWSTPTVAERERSPEVIKKLAKKRLETAGQKTVPLYHCEQAQLSGWPTTSCSNDRAARPAIMKREDGTKNQQRLQDLVALSGWPTPNASNGSGGGQAKRFTNPERSNELNDCVMLTQPIRLTATGETLIGSDAAMESSGQLNPAHSRWLMGLPPVWDDCAVTAMESLPRSRKPSSKQHKGGES